MKKRKENFYLHRRFLRSSKKNILAIFFSFALTFTLMTALLILLHTNHRIANLEAKAGFTPSDCYIEDVTLEQLAFFKEEEEISHLGITQAFEATYMRNSQTVFLNAGNQEFMTIMAGVTEGRLPEKKGEVAAEKWVLLNLGIEPKVNQTFQLQEEETGAYREFTLTGILSDMFGNKRYGVLNLYPFLDTEKDEKYIAYLTFEDSRAYEKNIKNIQKKLHISAEQIHECPAREDFQELYETDVKLVGVLLLICMVVFYGVYRIASISRKQQYGILRALGMGRKQLRNLILLELYHIYVVSVPVGLLQGWCLACLIMLLSGDLESEIYLYGEKVGFTPVFPGAALLVGMLFMAVFVGLVGYLAARSAGKASIVETITGVSSLNKKTSCIPPQSAPLRIKVQRAHGAFLNLCRRLTTRVYAKPVCAPRQNKPLRIKVQQAHLESLNLCCRSEADFHSKSNSSFFSVERAKSKNSMLVRIGARYLFQDKKISGFGILTICLGTVLFTGLVYQLQIVSLYRSDTKEMWNLNGQYAMTMRNFQKTDQGISRKDVQEIQNLAETAEVQTAAGMPIRVINETPVKRNEEFYQELNERWKKYNGYTLEGYDGTNQVYQTLLYGYSEHALQELKKYVLSGDFDPEHIAEDEIILEVLRMDDTKENENPGYYREGTPLMEYEAGDEIQIKYRQDFQTQTEEYAAFSDIDDAYVYKTFKIKAVVSCRYMYDCNRTLYPLLITSDEQLQKLAPASGIQCMYVDGKEDMSAREQTAFEQKLIRIGSKNEEVSTRSLISEIRQNEMFYRKQMVYICGIAAAAFVLILIYMTNNLKYRMQIRTREICMLRAVGMSVAMTKRMLLFENLFLGILGIESGYLLCWPVLGYLYQISDMRAFGHWFRFPYAAFTGVSVCVLGICAGLSFRILKEWRTRKVAEGIQRVE